MKYIVALTILFTLITTSLAGTRLPVLSNGNLADWEDKRFSGETSYTYDVAGRMTSLTDPESNTTTWEFGITGAVYTETITVSSSDLTRTFEYNAGGNIVSFRQAWCAPLSGRMKSRCISK